MDTFKNVVEFLPPDFWLPNRYINLLDINIRGEPTHRGCFTSHLNIRLVDQHCDEVG